MRFYLHIVLYYNKGSTSLMIITYPKWRCLHFIVCLDTSWAIIQMRRDCVFYFARVQLVSVWRADELMKIDSNYVEPRLTGEMTAKEAAY